MSDWRDNPNLVECYENCVAMFRRASEPAPEQNTSSKIRARRLALGLTQGELAARAVIPRVWISYAENGLYSPGWANIIATLDRLEQQ